MHFFQKYFLVTFQIQQLTNILIMSKPAKCIPVSEAKDLFNNWTNTRSTALNRSDGSKDACDFIYSIAELEEFLAYVKQESAKQGIKDPGVRIHFAAYDAANSDKATVFLAPTKGTASNALANYDIEPLNRGNTGWPPNKY